MLMECEVNGKSDLSPPSHSPFSPPGSPSLDMDTPSQDSPTETALRATTETLENIRQDYEAEISRVKKECASKLKEASKEKESMVMRFAKSEQEILRVRKEMDTMSRQVQNLTKELEAQNKKNKMLGTERERLINMVDAKVCDVQGLQKEVDRLREDNSSKDFKIKWTLNKLAAESDSHKETQVRLEKCSAELNVALEESIRMRQDCQDMINSYTPDPELCSSSTGRGVEVKERQVGPGEEEIPDSTSPLPVTSPDGAPPQLNPFQKEIEILKQKHRALIDENNSLSCRVQSLQEERLDLEHKMSRLHESNGDHLHQIASLQSDLACAESLRIQLISEQERVASLQSECDGLRQVNTDLLAEMSLCRGKEAELLAYTQQVTEKNVLLQSEFSSVEAKSLVLDGENQRLLTRIEDLLQQIKLGERSVVAEKKSAGQERQSLISELHLEKKRRLLLERQLEEASGETLLLKKRHETSLRELTKELKLAMRFAKEVSNGSGDGISQSSRTSSSTSLNNIETTNSHHHSTKSPPNEQDSEAPLIPDQQVLVERIVKLQRMLAKKQEKNEFLEEYAKDLRETAQRQRKIIQNYAMSLDEGTMTSDISDQNKAEFVRHGGIMGSLYASKSGGGDEGLTLDLSMEINRKLQAVLEDTLLKNITLKDNLATLGEENSKLTDRIRDFTAKLNGVGGDKRPPPDE